MAPKPDVLTLWSLFLTHVYKGNRSLESDLLSSEGGQGLSRVSLALKTRTLVEDTLCPRAFSRSQAITCVSRARLP